MLIVANGAFKSGSTWQRNLIRELMDFSSLPEEYAGGDQRKSFLHYKTFPEFVNSDLITREHYLAKAHIYKKEQVKILTDRPEYVKVFLIRRDLRDAIVSHYNHFINFRRIKPSFKTYYWTIGRVKAIEILQYNENWNGDFTNVHHSTFEDLRTNTAEEIKNFAKFLNVKVTDEKVEEIMQKNSLSRMRERSNHRKWFFRKGQIGDYKNYMSPAIERDLENLSNRRGLVEDASFKMFNAFRLIS